MKSSSSSSCNPVGPTKFTRLFIQSPTCTVASAHRDRLRSEPAKFDINQLQGDNSREKRVCSLPSATATFSTLLATSKSHQAIPLPSTTTHASLNVSNVKGMPDNLELEADASQPEENSEPPVLDIDDADDCSTSDDYIEKQKLDLPQEIIVKIREQTKTKLDSSTILPSYHFKSNMLANVDQTSIKVVLKYPGRSKYLLFDSKKSGTFFLLQ